MGLLTGANPWAVAADLIDPQGPDLANDPVAWAQARGVELWSKQREILDRLVHDDVAVHSCHNAGKSYTAANAAAWWLDAHRPGTAFVVTSAPTGDQVKGILWREIGRAHRRLQLPGRVNLTEWYIGNELVGFGRKPNDYEPTAFQGIHAEYVLVILDEACGIPRQLWDAAQSLTSNDASRILAIGNPDDPTSYFATACASGAYQVVHISAFDTPNFTGEPVGDVAARSLLSPAWVDKRRQEWGEDSPVYISKVLGQFPEETTDGVVPYAWAERCRRVEQQPAGEIELGLDVSGGGADRTVVWARQGPRALGKWEWRGITDPKVLGEHVLDVIQQTEASLIKIDSIGVGWAVGGMLDIWHEQGEHRCVVVPVNVALAADDDQHFLNLRAELWWAAREASRTETWDLSVLDDDDMAELCAVKYHTINPRQRIQVESKEQLKKRLGKSPDSADALLLAFHVPWFPVEVDAVSVVADARLPI